MKTKNVIAGDELANQLIEAFTKSAGFKDFQDLDKRALAREYQVGYLSSLLGGLIDDHPAVRKKVQTRLNFIRG